jgi:hypothetical protein
MSDNEVALMMSLPLDSDGFLRRECPTCEREFKWLHSTAEEGAAEVDDGGYFCPYCGIQAPTNAWLTYAQIALAHNLIATEALGPVLEGLGRNLSDLGSRSGGLLSAHIEYEAPEKLDPLTEDNDMRRVDFECHPSEPVKVLDDWGKPLHCLICGRLSS